MTCTDCQKASEEGQALLLTLTKEATYRTLCKRHRQELGEQLGKMKPATSKSYNTYTN